jgi:hypothetical protein
MDRRLSLLPLGFAISVLWGAGVLLMGLAAALWGWGGGFVDMLGSVYLGYSATVGGSLIGTAWALVDGFVCGVVVAWLYNRFAAIGVRG